MRCLVCNGWAAGLETWSLCAFPHDWIFDYVEQLDGLPERVMADLEDVVLVGFSMGSTMALRLFLGHPEKVRGLVLVSGTARMMEDRATGWKGMSLRRRAALRLGTRLVYGNDPSPLYDARNLERGLDYLQDADLREELLGRRSADAASRRASSGRSAPLDKPDPPVHLFQSEHDGIVRPENAAFLKRVFPQARVTMVPGSEHVLPVAIPELIDEAVRSCLKTA